MSHAVANALVLAGLAYLAAGVLFAVPFVARLVNRLDPDAAGGTLGFRLLILPGCAALWPLLLVRVLRRDRTPPLERGPHRTAGGSGA